MPNHTEVILYVNNSDPKVSRKNLSNEVKITQTFRIKEPVDVLRPVFTLARSTMENQRSAWNTYNYCKIPAFGNRQYFMTTKALNDSTVECTCEVDVLSTYIDTLRGMQFEVERSESSNMANSFLYADEQRPLQANKFTQLVPLGKLDETTGNNYVLTVSGGGTGT